MNRRFVFSAGMVKDFIDMIESLKARLAFGVRAFTECGLSDLQTFPGVIYDAASVRNRKGSLGYGIVRKFETEPEITITQLYGAESWEMTLWCDGETPFIELRSEDGSWYIEIHEFEWKLVTIKGVGN